MHHLDLGLFHYQIEYTRELLKNLHGNSLNDEIDRRLAKIPRFPGLKIFSYGIQSISRFTADDYKNLMKVMIFVIDNLYNNQQNVECSVKNKELMMLYQEWNEMYLISRYEEFSESDLKKFEVCKNKKIFLNYFTKLRSILKNYIKI
jgi:hypothetical protein